MFVLKPGRVGAIGRARWRNSSESIAILFVLVVVVVAGLGSSERGIDGRAGRGVFEDVSAL